MKFRCKKEHIKHKITLAVRATGKNSTLPVLGGILLRVQGKTLSLRTTNLDIGLEFNLPVASEGDGEVVVPAGALSQLIGGLPAGDREITFEVVENNLSISTEGNTALLKTLPSDDFPSLPTPESKKEISLPAGDLKTLVRSVSFAAASSDIKPEIASVLLYGDGSHVVSVATDSFRLAEKKVPHKAKEFENILVPARNAQELIKVFEDIGEGDVTLSFDNNQLAVKTSDRYFTTRLTDGVYPNYKQILPREFKTELTVLREELVQGLRSAHTFLDSFNRMTINVLTEDSLIEIETKNSDVGEGLTRIDAHIKGDDVSMGFNYRYVTDVLSVIATDSVSFKFTGSDRPMTITGVGDTTFTYLVMPVTR